MMTKKQTYDLIDKFNPSCGLTGFLMIVGCFSDIGLTLHFEWPWYAFVIVFISIMLPGKGLKILDKFIGRKSLK